MFYPSESDLVKYKWAEKESSFKSLKFVRSPEVPEARRVTGVIDATSKILKFGFLSMKDSLHIPGSALLEYKWAKKESFFQSLKFI